MANKKNIAAMYDVTIEPIFDEVNTPLNKNANLRKTRDVLLPKLISGELDVEDLNIRVAEEAEA